MTGVLERLVRNSQAAIGDGIYEVDADMRGSGKDLARIMRADRHPVLITEIKFASPSMGKIRTVSDPAVVAGMMVSGGARALSVLTQPYLFGGLPEYLIRVRRAVDVPLLMKDIFIDYVQIDAARRIGADYILLIQSLFDKGYLEDLDGFIRYGHKNGLKVLLEVHTRQEFDDAVGSDADLVGINNRNLDTLEIDLGTTRRILEGFDGSRQVVSESGINTAQDITYLRDAGASGFLVGSSIMRHRDIEGHVRGLVNAY